MNRRNNDPFAGVVFSISSSNCDHTIANILRYNYIIVRRHVKSPDYRLLLYILSFEIGIIYIAWVIITAALLRTYKNIRNSTDTIAHVRIHSPITSFFRLFTDVIRLNNASDNTNRTAVTNANDNVYMLHAKKSQICNWSIPPPFSYRHISTYRSVKIDLWRSNWTPLINYPFSNTTVYLSCRHQPITDINFNHPQAWLTVPKAQIPSCTVFTPQMSRKSDTATASKLFWFLE